MAIRQAASTSASPSPLRSSAQLEGAHSATPGDAEDIYNIEKSVLLDIAFLHSIATHRPIGPHKHFNVIPILLNLDRTARQVGARIRDDEYTRGASGGEDEREGSLTRTIKKEETAEEDDTSKASIAFASLPIDSQVIWMRLAQLYDIGGLEELENLAIDNDVASPFRNGHSLYNRMTSIRPSLAASSSTRYGFGSGLEKKKKAPSTTTPKSGRSNHKKTATIEEADDSNDAAINEQQAEFELGPWDEFETLIAPRRLKSYAPQEDGQSDSEEELSEPSEGEVEAVDDEEEQQEEGDEALSEADEGEEGEEEEEEDDEMGDTSSSKRKASSKKQGASSKKGKKASSPTVKRGTRNSAKPRRSARR